MRSVQEIFDAHCGSKIATAKHLLFLCELAKECKVIWELGVNWGASSSAFLQGLPRDGKLVSVDLKITPKAFELQQAAGEKWSLIQGDSLKAELPGPLPDLIFFDSLHTYQQLYSELQRFGPKSREYLVFHDTITFAVQGADGEKGTYLPQPRDRSIFEAETHGIRLAIDAFQIANPCWDLEFHHPWGHGLLGLRRRF